MGGGGRLGFQTQKKKHLLEEYDWIFSGVTQFKKNSLSLLRVGQGILRCRFQMTVLFCS